MNIIGNMNILKPSVDITKNIAKFLTAVGHYKDSRTRDNVFLTIRSLTRHTVIKLHLLTKFCFLLR